MSPDLRKRGAAEQRVIDAMVAHVTRLRRLPQAARARVKWIVSGTIWERCGADSWLRVGDDDQTQGLWGYVDSKHVASEPYLIEKEETRLARLGPEREVEA